MMAGVIDIGATWLIDLKFGLCPSAFYLNKEQCCWSSNETVIDISGNCSHWLSWAEILGYEKADSDTAGAYCVMYLLYVCWAVGFAALAASLVRMFAPYACGSGIPEIKVSLLR
jgi:chloride channel 3/4/5